LSKEKLVENIMTSGFLMYKRLSKGMNASDLPRSQFELLYFISLENDKPMKYYGDKLMISKPNLTVMADKLIGEGYVERVFEPSDRRIIILRLTQHGENYLYNEMVKIKQTMVKRFEALNDSEVERLDEIIDEMKNIFNKID
jgi:DNA-binding MarR family transcriptional regulator